MRLTGTRGEIIGFQIVSEDGTVLQAVNFDYGFTLSSLKDGVDLLKIHGKLYLSFNGRSNDSSAVLLCSIDSANSVVRVMSMEKVSSVPTRSYDLSGRHTKGEQGINIIRMGDGTTKKVLVR